MFKKNFQKLLMEKMQNVSLQKNNMSKISVIFSDYSTLNYRKLKLFDVNLHQNGCFLRVIF